MVLYHLSEELNLCMCAHVDVIRKIEIGIVHFDHRNWFTAA